MISKVYLDTMHNGEKFVVLDEDNKDVRCMKESENSIFVFFPRKKSYGYRYPVEAFITMPYKMKVVDEASRWQRKITKARKILEKSGLWPELLEIYSNLEKIGYDDYKVIAAICNSRPIEWYRKETSSDQRKSFFGKYAEKYPFIFDEEGHINPDYYGEVSDPTFKTIKLGYCSQMYKKEIAEAISSKAAYNTESVLEKYDHSFRYDPGVNRAWYNEEYHNCGNGYYYLALDENTAIFYEKD